MRLDPNTRAAVAEPNKEKKEPTDSVVTMSPFIVKSLAITANEPEREKQSSGPFSPLTGGWVARTDTGGMRGEFGAWPYQNILWKSDRFKSDLKHAGTEFFRLSW